VAIHSFTGRKPPSSRASVSGPRAAASDFSPVRVLLSPSEQGALVGSITAVRDAFRGINP
jgi:hypothetical protein